MVDAILITEAFRRALEGVGITTDARLVADGSLHRFHVDGHRRGTHNGAYVLHANGVPAGWYKNFVTGAEGTWCYGGGSRRMDDDTRRQIAEERARRQAEREAKHAAQAKAARAIWDAALPCNGHPYLERKQIGAHGVRLHSGPWTKWHQDDAGRWRKLDILGALLVPLRDEQGTIRNLQAIFPSKVPDLGNRDKDFMPGRKAGLFHVIGESTDTVCIAEGYATGATLYKECGHQTYIAFDCGNLLAVAKAVRKLHPSASIIVCADNDHATPGNPGVTKATEAARAIGGKLAVPDFPPGCHGTDFNDMMLMQGGAHGCAA